MFIVFPIVYRLTLTQCQNICTIFFADCSEKHINRWFIWNCVINIIFQGRNTLHQEASRIYWKYQYCNSILYFDVIFLTQFYIHTLYCIYFKFWIFGLYFTHKYKIQNRTRLFRQSRKGDWRGDYLSKLKRRLIRPRFLCKDRLLFWWGFIWV